MQSASRCSIPVRIEHKQDAKPVTLNSDFCVLVTCLHSRLNICPVMFESAKSLREERHVIAHLSGDGDRHQASYTSGDPLMQWHKGISLSKAARLN